MLFLSQYFLAHVSVYNQLAKLVQGNPFFYRLVIRYGVWILYQEIKAFHILMPKDVDVDASDVYGVTENN